MNCHFHSKTLFKTNIAAGSLYSPFEYTFLPLFSLFHFSLCHTSKLVNQGFNSRHLLCSHLSLFVFSDPCDRWIYGDWTDDTDQMILILDSIIENNGKIDHLDFAQKLKKWVQQGFPELGDSTSSGCGQNTYRVIKHSSYEEDPIAASTAVWELSG
eukprot:TRINITY_DN2241_c0_g1_i1.p1 TRINITY_DN2241_c0_g1~~TRINITY_DN2241_c0_g1_i1.p1  ORF type:complete len:156 (+),score=17.68 TRINITY_DN2241_c0_g1_i1:184-651(+)